MTASQLKPFPSPPAPKPKTPRCEATITVTTEHERQWREKRYKTEGSPFRCTRESAVTVDGCHYCRLHGGHVTLDLYLAGKLIERKS